MPPATSLFQRAASAFGASTTVDGSPRTASVMVVRAAVAPLLVEPRASSSQIAQALSGHALAVEQREGEWFRVRGGDGYEAWVHAGYLGSPTELGLDASWSQTAMLSLGAQVTGPRGARALPLGALLLPEERLVSGDAVVASELRTRFPATPTAVIESAQAYFAGTSYQWGGITAWACDCSGFVQTLFALHGVALPRDSWQQALEGDDAGREMLAVDAGALHFFSDRADDRITHVGVGAGAGAIMHVSLGRGGFAVDELDANDPYVSRLRAQWRGARYVLPTV